METHKNYITYDIFVPRAQLYSCLAALTLVLSLGSLLLAMFLSMEAAGSNSVNRLTQSNDVKCWFPMNFDIC